MSIFRRKNGGVMDVIRCDEPSYLIWKWHPAGSQPGNNKRENAIRYGSVLHVKEGEVAVFAYRKDDGTQQEFIEGPFDQQLDTNNLPILSKLLGLVFAGDTPFQAEVYFINLAQIVQVRFAVPFFDVFDPRFPDFGVPTAVRGTISFNIKDYREFIKLHQLSAFSLETFKNQIRDAVARYVKDTVANAPAAHNIPVVQIESKIAQINDAIEYDIGERLRENFGVNITGVDIGAIEIDKASSGYTQLMAITKNATTETVKAETAAKVQDIHDRQRTEAENYAETLRIQREEAQYSTHKATQSGNFAAYQVEAQTEVGVAGAEALGHMGENGAGKVELGGGGFNPAALMAGMALGGAVGQNIAGTINHAMSGMQVTQSGTTPPPIPAVGYYVAVNGQPTGPFAMDVLKQMASAGQLSAVSLVWKDGMKQWGKAGDVDELKDIIASAMPEIPN